MSNITNANQQKENGGGGVNINKILRSQMF